jgi:hypothetical protein
MGKSFQTCFLTAGMPGRQVLFYFIAPLISGS